VARGFALVPVLLVVALWVWCYYAYVLLLCGRIIATTFVAVVFALLFHLLSGLLLWAYLSAVFSRLTPIPPEVSLALALRHGCGWLPLAPSFAPRFTPSTIASRPVSSHRRGVPEPAERGAVLVSRAAALPAPSLFPALTPTVHPRAQDTVLPSLRERQLAVQTHDGGHRTWRLRQGMDDGSRSAGMRARTWRGCRPPLVPNLPDCEARPLQALPRLRPIRPEV
jgi:hypothetical protein